MVDDFFVLLLDFIWEELIDGRMFIQVEQKCYVVDVLNKGVIGDDFILFYQGDINSFKLLVYYVVFCFYGESRVCFLV